MFETTPSSQFAKEFSMLIGQKVIDAFSTALTAVQLQNNK